MRVSLAWSLLLGCLLCSACNYRETVGTTGGGGGGSTPDATPQEECSSFVVPSYDCTLDQGTCTFPTDCPGLNQDCNVMTRRCFSSDETCVGTPCGFDEDCPSGERCNLVANVCFDLSMSQTCMPCFLLSSDCGTGTCDSDLGRCI